MTTTAIASSNKRKTKQHHIVVPSSSAETARNIASLLEERRSSDDERYDATRLDELRRIFAKLISSGHLSFSPSSKDKNKNDNASYSSSSLNDNTAASAAAKWNAFLLKKHRLFASQLCRRIRQGKKSAVRTMWGVIASSPIVVVVPSSCSTGNRHSSQHERLCPDLVYEWMQSMMLVPNHMMDKTMKNMIQGEFLHPYRDVQYYALTAIAKLAGEEYRKMRTQEERIVNDVKKKQQDMTLATAERLFQLLLMIPIPTSQDEMEQSNYLYPPSRNEEGSDVNSDNDDGDEEEVSVATNPSIGSDEDDDSLDDDTSSDEEDRRTHEVALQLHTSKKRKRDESSPVRSKRRQFSFQQLKSHRKALSNAWLAVLKLPLPTPALKSALQFLPASVFPHIANPLLFADFFMQAYAHSGVIGVLALDGLFVLMTQYGLEYPLFYTSLYRLVQQPSILYVKYRTRFLELLTRCLCRNEMLPAYLVAAFCKRLLRSALTAPPTSILYCLALVSNLLRKHPECACLIHRVEERMQDDPFDEQTHDPTESRALESSLWELSALAHHYYPAIATLARSIGTENETTPLHEMDDFLRHTYKSLFEQERKRSQSSNRKRRKVPLTFVEPTSLIGSDDVLSGMLKLS